MIEVKVITDSVSAGMGKRITTLQLKYPRYIHAELMTHRVFSRNASSSRAIPTGKLAQDSLANLVEPVRWGKNQAGMQAQMEDLDAVNLAKAKAIWKNMAEVCAKGSAELAELGLHKQWANRPTEWFGHISVVLTSTEWDNWFALRAHEAAQPEIHALAIAMRKVMDESQPVLVGINEWHLPYITEDEKTTISIDTLLKMSAARCARVSYLKHDGATPSIEEDLALYTRLVGSMPIHASPCEHQATPLQGHANSMQGNFVGWAQFRKLVEKEFDGAK